MKKNALDKLSLNLNEGDFVTIIGANGAGKSTLFNAICGTFYTDEGQIILDGEDITLQPDYIRAKKIRSSVSGSHERHCSWHDH